MFELSVVILISCPCLKAPTNDSTAELTSPHASVFNSNNESARKCCVCDIKHAFYGSILSKSSLNLYLF